jgi:hypothetical protein
LIFLPRAFPSRPCLRPLGIAQLLLLCPSTRMFQKKNVCCSSLLILTKLLIKLMVTS